MYCPNCRGEFVAGVEVCNSCDIALVDALPEEPERPPIDWITVATYREPAQARLASEYLEAADLTVQLTNEYTIGVNWLLATGIGEVGLQVPAEQEQLARQALESMTVDPEKSDEPAEFAGGHVDQATLERARRDNRYKVLLTLVVAAPVVFLFGLLAYLGRSDQESTSDARDSDA
ncbi:MAG TPA: hypothetical protein VGS57_01770 [Thermoanaerobaculia bacterium]|jgi:hypothetical protein|nr:hypothetical protein [Thermoanaerobaculia bacterium]